MLDLTRVSYGISAGLYWCFKKISSSYNKKIITISSSENSATEQAKRNLHKLLSLQVDKNYYNQHFLSAQQSAISIGKKFFRFDPETDWHIEYSAGFYNLILSLTVLARLAEGLQLIPALNILRNTLNPKTNSDPLPVLYAAIGLAFYDGSAGILNALFFKFGLKVKRNNSNLVHVIGIRKGLGPIVSYLLDILAHIGILADFVSSDPDFSFAISIIAPSFALNAIRQFTLHQGFFKSLKTKQTFKDVLKTGLNYPLPAQTRSFEPNPSQHLLHTSFTFFNELAANFGIANIVLRIFEENIQDFADDKTLQLQFLPRITLTASIGAAVTLIDLFSTPNKLDYLRKVSIFEDVKLLVKYSVRRTLYRYAIVLAVRDLMCAISNTEVCGPHSLVAKGAFLTMGLVFSYALGIFEYLGPSKDQQKVERNAFYKPQEFIITRLENGELLVTSQPYQTREFVFTVQPDSNIPLETMPLEELSLLQIIRNFALTSKVEKRPALSRMPTTTNPNSMLVPLLADRPFEVAKATQLQKEFLKSLRTLILTQNIGLAPDLLAVFLQRATQPQNFFGKAFRFVIDYIKKPLHIIKLLPKRITVAEKAINEINPAWGDEAAMENIKNILADFANKQRLDTDTKCWPIIQAMNYFIDTWMIMLQLASEASNDADIEDKLVQQMDMLLIDPKKAEVIELKDLAAEPVRKINENILRAVVEKICDQLLARDDLEDDVHATASNLKRDCVNPYVKQLAPILLGLIKAKQGQGFEHPVVRIILDAIAIDVLKNAAQPTDLSLLNKPLTPTELQEFANLAPKKQRNFLKTIIIEALSNSLGRDQSLETAAIYCSFWKEGREKLLVKHINKELSELSMPLQAMNL